jgi:hypothetical protein
VILEDKEGEAIIEGAACISTWACLVGGIGAGASAVVGLGEGAGVDEAKAKAAEDRADLEAADPKGPPPREVAATAEGAGTLGEGVRAFTSGDLALKGGVLGLGLTF